MDKFVSYLKELNVIGKGDTVYVISDMMELAKVYRLSGEKLVLDDIIDGLKDLVGEEGTLLFPAFNWDFCSGKPFDVSKTVPKTGALPKAAFKRNDFVRTKHPLYSFMVWGKHAGELSAIDVPNAFGAGTIFEKLSELDAKALAIGVSALSGLTYIHHVEKMTGVPYRYEKEFTADYTGRDGITSSKTCSMYVRDLDMDPRHINGFEPLEKIMLNDGIIKRFYYETVPVSCLKVNDTDKPIRDDILINDSRNMYTFNGQRV